MKPVYRVGDRLYYRGIPWVQIVIREVRRHTYVVDWHNTKTGIKPYIDGMKIYKEFVKENYELMDVFHAL